MINKYNLFLSILIYSFIFQAKMTNIYGNIFLNVGIYVLFCHIWFENLWILDFDKTNNLNMSLGLQEIIMEIFTYFQN